MTSYLFLQFVGGGGPSGKSGRSWGRFHSEWYRSLCRWERRRKRCRHEGWPGADGCSGSPQAGRRRQRQGAVGNHCGPPVDSASAAEVFVPRCRCWVVYLKEKDWSERQEDRSLAFLSPSACSFMYFVWSVAQWLCIHYCSQPNRYSINKSHLTLTDRVHLRLEYTCTGHIQTKHNISSPVIQFSCQQFT